MDLEFFIAILIFCFISSVSPGPNNIMLMTSGLNFGIKQTIPQMLGISIGFGLLCLITGLGLGSLIKAFPQIFFILKIFGSLYLIWLAYKIANTKAIDKNTLQKPFSFIETFIFQWLNPKAWIISISALSVYTDNTQPIKSALLISLCFIIVNIPAMFIWAGLGKFTRKLLDNPKSFRIFNYSMAFLLLLSLFSIFSN